MDWIRIGSSLALLDIWDSIGGMAAGLALIALYSLISTIIQALRAKRGSRPDV